MQICELSFHHNALVPTQNAQIPVASHVINFGTGIFESLRIYSTRRGVVTKGLYEHIKRLRNSLSSIGLPPLDTDFVHDAMNQFVTENKIKNGYVRILAYPDSLCDALDTLKCGTNMSIIGWHVGEERVYQPFTMHLSYMRRANASSTLDSLIQSQSKQYGYDTGLLMNEDGTICEAAGANLFIVRNGALYTPHVINSIHGITARIVIEIAKSLQIEVHALPLILDDVVSADEAFITGTFVGIRPIQSVEKFSLANVRGEITSKIIDKFEEMIEGEHVLSERWMTRF
jgi:branched-chain amino acid aminotransferase